ncbi:MAG: hydrogenase maturation nickel metallochaperone HypA [Candidatus Eisenbacteria bacterium]|nr:hydrogenase maturation nickel metallochaperone HypA [Candidatus Eisenbacteria bacterium]
MHELSLALSILEIVGAEIARAGGSGCELRDVREVGVRIGTLSGVEPEALDFAWESMRLQAGCPAARLSITLVPARAVCERCGDSFLLGQGEGECAHCGVAPFRLTEGRELEVRRIVCGEPDEQAEAAAQEGGRRA